MITLHTPTPTGDHAFKTNETLTSIEQMISPEPDVRTLDLIDGDDFMILACDGIWFVRYPNPPPLFLPDTHLSFSFCTRYNKLSVKKSFFL